MTVEEARKYYQEMLKLVEEASSLIGESGNFDDFLEHRDEFYY